MAAHRYPADKPKSKDALSEILDFGAEEVKMEPLEFSERVRSLKEKIDQMHLRIARLMARAG